MKTYVQVWKYVSEFFIEWQMFQAKVVGLSRHTFYVQCTVMLICHRVFHIMTNVSDKSCTENQNTHFVFN